MFSGTWRGESGSHRVGGIVGKNMGKLILSTCVFFGSVAADAEVIKCYFTEPFVVSIFSTEHSTLSYREASMGIVQTIENVSFRIRDAGFFELVDEEGKILQTLTLNHNGSDGMSDDVYPFEVKDENSAMTGGSNYGGCTSSLLDVQLAE